MPPRGEGNDAVVNLSLLWISALFYVALVSALYVVSVLIVGGVFRLEAKLKQNWFTQSGRKRSILAALSLPPFLALLPTGAGVTLRHMHPAAPYAAFHSEQAAPLAHHAMACQQLFDRLALLGGLGMGGNTGHAVSVLVGGAAWALLLAGLVLTGRLLWATLRLEKGISPLLSPPSPRLAASLLRVGRSFPKFSPSRFFECAIPAAYSSVLGLLQARCVLSAPLVASAPDDELDAVVAHEASHLRSGDVYATFLVGLLNCVFFFLRPVRFLSRLWRESAELASDDAAVRATRNPLAMAAAILRVSGIETAAPSRSLPAVALPFADESACAPAKRVERLLDQAQRAALPAAAETRLQVVLGWMATALFATVGLGLLLSSEVACVTHCALELVERFV